VVSVEEVGVVRDKEGEGRKERRKEKRGNIKTCGKERKVEQEKAKKIDIWTEWKREIGNNKLKKKKKKMKRIKI
jgi:hypothetical protein